MKKLKQRILNIGLNPKSELSTFLIINILIIGLGLFLSIFYKNLIIGLVTLVLTLAFSYLFYSRYSIYEEDRRRKLEYEFCEVFSYLRIYLVNKENVYTAINKANQYTGKDMSFEIKKFTNEIDEDKTIVPFLNFSKNFKNKTIEEVMIALYQMVDGGYTDNYINQFIKIFENYKERTNKVQFDKRYKKLNSLSMMSLIGVAYLMFVILLLIVNIIGELTNGL